MLQRQLGAHTGCGRAGPAAGASACAPLLARLQAQAAPAAGQLPDRCSPCSTSSSKSTAAAQWQGRQRRSTHVVASACPPGSDEQQAQPEQQPPLSASSSSSSSSNISHRSRRTTLLGGAAAATLALTSSAPPAAHALAIPPPGFRAQDDKLDGYCFFYPESWLPITSSGNDCFFRNPRNIEENCFVDLTSPSSSTFASVADLGSAEQAAKVLLDQYLNKEFMSTRIGIRREGKILFAAPRTGADGRTYYDIGVRISSYGSRNPYVATQGEVLQEYGLEWDRVLQTTLGVANKRLYELRLQTAEKTYEANKPTLEKIRDSFVLRDVET